MIRLAALAVLLAPSIAVAAPPVIGPQPDIGSVATAAAAAVATANAALAAMPKPATTPPPGESSSGAVGTDTRYALANHTHPRVSWSPVVTTVAGGTFSGTIPSGMFTAITIDLTWKASGPTVCQLSAYSLTSFAGNCYSLSVASILAAGSGVEVHVVVLPRSGA